MKAKVILISLLRCLALGLTACANDENEKKSSDHTKAEMTSIPVEPTQKANANYGKGL